STTVSATAAAAEIAIRARNVMRSPFAQRVSDPADRVDEAREAALLGLATEVADVHVERIGGRSEVVPPDPLEDDRARQHLARIPEEQLQERELRAREIDRPPAAAHLACARIELEVREA